jgi:hypothetical protein
VAAGVAPVPHLGTGAQPLRRVRDPIYLDHALMGRRVTRFARQVLAVSAAHFSSPIFEMNRSTSEIVSVTARFWRIERV